MIGGILALFGKPNLFKCKFDGRISCAMLDPSLVFRIVVGAYRFIKRRLELAGSTSWPMADGKVFDGRVEQSEVQGWAAELTYSYSALGDYYSGTFSKTFLRKNSAEAFLQRFPRGTPIAIRYKAEDPQVSTLLLSDVGLLVAGL